VLGVLECTGTSSGSLPAGRCSAGAVAALVSRWSRNALIQWRVEILDLELARLLAGLALSEAEQQPEGVAICSDGVLADALLVDQPLGEERLACEPVVAVLVAGLTRACECRRAIHYGQPPTTPEAPVWGGHYPDVSRSPASAVNMIAQKLSRPNPNRQTIPIVWAQSASAMLSSANL
jgi:hypothetical protein